MKIFVSASTAVAGGGAQRTANFIANSIRKPCGHKYIYVVSPQIMTHLKSVVTDSFENVYELTPSPVSVITGRSSRKKLLELERKFKPDIIYSIAAPSYVKFRTSCEISYLTDPWLTHPNALAYSVLSRSESLKIFFKRLFYKWWFRREKYFIVQTPIAASGLARQLKIPESNIEIIPNCYNQLFLQNNDSFRKETTNEKLIFALAYPHYAKNLDLIPDIAAILKKSDMKFKFVMTLPINNKLTLQIMQKAKDLDVTDLILNVEHLTLPECCQWYDKSDILFLPTLLETFSASYIEAMTRQRPIITTDFDFARDVCGNAAEYFEPMNPLAASMAITSVLNNPKRYKELVQNGLNRLKSFPDPSTQYMMQIQALEKCYANCHNAQHQRCKIERM